MLWALCGVWVHSATPLPPEIPALYRQAFGCRSKPPPKDESSILPYPGLSAYFPTTPRYWPVLYGADTVLLREVRYWKRQGIHPILLLAGNAYASSPSRKVIRWKTAIKEGAIPFFSLYPETPARLQTLTNLWCFRGICPAGWYLPNGVGSAISFLPKATYLVAPHFQGRDDWPVPLRELHWNGAVLYPLFQDLQIAGGTGAVTAFVPKNITFSPPLRYTGEVLGFSYHWTDNHYISALGLQVIQVIGSALLAGKELLRRLEGNWLFGLSEELPWAVSILKCNTAV